VASSEAEDSSSSASHTYVIKPVTQNGSESEAASPYPIDAARNPPECRDRLIMITSIIWIGDENGGDVTALCI
jgi:hypothetical protein